MINDRFCNLLEACNTPEAPLCPLQEVTIRRGIWYSDEPICQCELFQNLPWIKKQKLIADLRLKPDAGFFTVKMLNSLRLITKNLKGADPDDANAEKKWLQSHRKKNGKSANSKGIKKTATRKKYKKTSRPKQQKRLL